MAAEIPTIEPPFIAVLGGWVQSQTRDQLVGRLLAAGRARSGLLVGHHNLHSLALARRDPAMRRFYASCGAIFIDSMPLAWMARLCGHPLRRHHRLTAIDWVPPLCTAMAASGLRLGFIGGRDGVWQRGFAAIRQSHHSTLALTIHGESGFFDHRPGSVESDAIIARMNAFAPHVLCVGLGMPLQERWLLANHHRLNAGCIVTVGAVLDYFAGEIPMPPRWMGSCGLEWLFRLASEPRRLAYRYLVEPWPLLEFALADLTRPPRRVRTRIAPPPPYRFVP